MLPSQGIFDADGFCVNLLPYCQIGAFESRTALVAGGVNGSLSTGPQPRRWQSEEANMRLLKNRPRSVSEHFSSPPNPLRRLVNSLDIGSIPALDMETAPGTWTVTLLHGDSLGANEFLDRRHVISPADRLDSR